MENEVDASLLHVEKCVHTLTESFRSTQRQISRDTLLSHTHRDTDTPKDRHIHTHTHKCKDSLRHDFVNS